MNLQKDPNLKTMLIIALLVIALLADHCEGVKCHQCGIPKEHYGNCGEIPPNKLSEDGKKDGAPLTSDCKRDNCVTLITKYEGKTEVTRGCYSMENCANFIGCKEYNREKFVEIFSPCIAEVLAEAATRSGNLTNTAPIEEKLPGKSGNNPESRRTPPSVTYKACVCSGDLCNSEEVETNSSDTLSVKMAVPGMIIMLINIAIAATAV